MLTLLEYINAERSNFPDEVWFNDKWYNTESKYARPFIINIKTHQSLFGEIGQYHCKMSKLKIMLKFFCTWDSLKDEYRVKTSTYHGRIWVINDTDINTVLICWWEDLNDQNFYELNKELILKYNKKFNTNITKALVVNNNDEFVNFDINNKNIEHIKPRSSDNKKLKEMHKIIHLASQKDKEEYFKQFKKIRDENNQTKYYNHTKSKTEAEWRSIKYQESLEE